MLLGTPKRYQDPGLWAWLEIVSSQEEPVIKQHIVSCHKKVSTAKALFRLTP